MASAVQNECDTDRSNEADVSIKKNVEQTCTSGSALLDAAKYVEAVMSSQQITAVLRTPMAAHSNRKRHLSLPAVGESEVKKIRSDMNDILSDDSETEEAINSTEGRGHETTCTKDRTMRNVVRARRNLLGQNKGAMQSKKETEAKTSSDTDTILKAMEKFQNGLVQKIDEMNRLSNEKFDTMKNEIQKIRNDFNNRIEGLAKKVETKVTKTIDKELDTKVKSMRSGFDKEINKIKTSSDKILKSVNKLEETTLPTFKEELGDEIDELNRRLKQLEEVRPNGQAENRPQIGDDLKRSIVIKNLEERENENVKDRVNSLIYNGLRLDRIEVESATRKSARSESKSGVIVATCKSLKDKEDIMKRKSDLKKSRRYANVYIEHHMQPEQRRLNNNLRTIVNTIGNDRLRLKGSRILSMGNEGNYEHSNSYKRSSRPYGGTYRDNYDDYNSNRNNDYGRNYHESRGSGYSYHSSDSSSRGRSSSSRHEYNSRR